ncbi:MAG TPA: SCO family protein [Stellaceae bacterium]|nr:SCO family protein [Stellaceae bacterium]
MTDTAQKPGNGPRFVRIAVILAAILVAAAGGLLVYALRDNPKGGPGSVLDGAIGGPFHLVDQNAKPFTDADLKGKWSLVFFGFTHCTDVCPTTLNELSLAFDKLSRKARAKVAIVFVSVDPARDTPAVLKTYLESFDAPVVGLTGTAAEVKQVAKDYHVYYAKHPLPGGGYDMDHSSLIYVMDPQGRYRSILSLESTADQMVTRLQHLMS